MQNHRDRIKQMIMDRIIALESKQALINKGIAEVEAFVATEEHKRQGVNWAYDTLAHLSERFAATCKLFQDLVTLYDRIDRPNPLGLPIQLELD